MSNSNQFAVVPRLRLPVLSTLFHSLHLSIVSSCDAVLKPVGFTPQKVRLAFFAGADCTPCEGRLRVAGDCGDRAAPLCFFVVAAA